MAIDFLTNLTDEFIVQHHTASPQYKKANSGLLNLSPALPVYS